jgi:cell filamentation protein
MDPYVYPGTNVLRNRRNIRDWAALAVFEADATSWRIRQLEHKPTRGNLNGLHLQAIHRHIFQDLYSWAGEFRLVEIARPGQFYFALTERIVPCLNDLFAGLLKERDLADAKPAEEFCNRAAWYMGELNAIHSFRDGNGRTQREFIRQLAVKNGFTLDWAHVTRDAMNEASGKSFQQADNTGLAAILRTAIHREA